MKITAFFTISILLTGCGGGSSSSSSVKSFDTSSYTERSSNTSPESMTGTWIGVHTIIRERTDAINASVTPNFNSKILEMAVIRPNEEKLEMSLCGVGFEEITVSDNSLVSNYRLLKVTNARSMTDSGSSQKTIRLGLGSYKETTSYTIDYVKVSDSYTPFGTLTMNWSDTTGDTQREIYCSTVERYDDGYQTVSLTGDTGVYFFMSELSGPGQYDAYISDKNHAGAISNYLTLGEQNFSFSVNGPEQFLLNYNATNLSGLSVSGQASFALPAN